MRATIARLVRISLAHPEISGLITGSILSAVLWVALGSIR